MSGADDEREPRINLMQADLDLVPEHGFVATTAAIFGASGYTFGSQSPPAINVHLDAPLVVQQAPAQTQGCTGVWR